MLTLGGANAQTTASQTDLATVAATIPPGWTQTAAKTANYTATAYEIVVIDTSGGTFTVTGPTNGKPFGFRWKAGTTAPTVAAPSGYTVSGAATVTPGLAPATSSGELVLWQAFSGDYQPIGGLKPQSALNAANDARGNVYPVTSYGVSTSNTSTVNTTALQALTSTVIAAGGGTIFFPSGVFPFDTWTISGTTNVNLTITGSPGTILLADSSLTSDAVTLSSGATTPGVGFLRRVRFNNLSIHSTSTNWNSSSKAARRGLVIHQAQDIELHDVWLCQFRQGALVLDDCYDSVFGNVQVLWSGIAASDTDYAYAVQLTGTIDNSNSNHFAALHVEQSPLMLSVDHLSRHNQWVNCKFERLGTTASEDNSTTKSPIYFVNSLENSLTNCFFAENKASDVVPFIRSDDNTDSYTTTALVQKYTVFANCSFAGASTAKTRWFVGYDTEFSGCSFHRCNGATTGYVFDFQSRNILRDSTIRLVDANSNTVRFNGNYNVVADNRIWTVSSGTAGALYFVGTGATFNRAEDNHIVGGVTSPLSTSLTDLGTNILAYKFSDYKAVTGGGTPSTFGYDVLRFADSTAASYTNFLHGYKNKRLTLVATTAFSTLTHGANLNLAGNTTRTLRTGESVTLVNVSGAWREQGATSSTAVALKSGYYYYATSPTISTTASLGSGNLRVAPVVVTSSVTLAALLAEVTTVGEAGSKVRLGIYADDGSGYPGVLVVDAGQIAGDSATLQSATISVTLTPGVYWFGGVGQVITTTSPTVRVATSWTPPILLPAGNTTPAANGTAHGWGATGQTGTLPTTYPTGASIVGSVPRLMFQVA